MTRPRVTSRPIWLNITSVVLMLIAGANNIYGGIYWPYTPLYTYILVALGVTASISAWIIAERERDALRKWMEEHQS